MRPRRGAPSLAARMAPCSHIPLSAAGVYQALPGPEATELACYFGLVAKGYVGAMLGGLWCVLVLRTDRQTCSQLPQRRCRSQPLPPLPLLPQFHPPRLRNHAFACVPVHPLRPLRQPGALRLVSPVFTYIAGTPCSALTPAGRRLQGFLASFYGIRPCVPAFALRATLKLRCGGRLPPPRLLPERRKIPARRFFMS